ncbi:hypothetical protein [Saccharothrix lopnurensis]|uniref:Transposase n=1 Tax=Saccharothrix lopnurensis TaxID=1670621 RepID=A0ABW1PIE0_9PSEU
MVDHRARNDVVLGRSGEALKAPGRGERYDRPTATESEELRRLRKENAELKRANEILKAASVEIADVHIASGGTCGGPRVAAPGRSCRASGSSG